MAEQLKHCQCCQSTLHLYYSLGVRPLGFSGLMYVQCPGCGHVAKIKLGKTHYCGNNKRGIGTFDIMQKLQQVHFIHVVSELDCVTTFS